MSTIRGLSCSAPKTQVFTWPRPFPRTRSSLRPNVCQPSNYFRYNGMKLHGNLKQFNVSAAKKQNTNPAEDTSDGESTPTKSITTKKRSPGRPKKKPTTETTTLQQETPIEETAQEEIHVQITNPNSEQEEDEEPAQPEEPQTSPSLFHKSDEVLSKLVASFLITDEDEENKIKNRKKKGTKRKDMTRYEVNNRKKEQEELMRKIEKTLSNLLALDEKIVRDEDHDTVIEDYASFPPLVCCFGSAKSSFIPFARPANRIINTQIHEAMPEFYWSPEKFFRAPGGAANCVAMQLADLGGRVQFMGGLGNDSLGRELLRELNINYVQTRSMKLDDDNSTSVSRMKLVHNRDTLKAECVQKCAEDYFFTSDVDLDILKEAKMLYFNSSALMDPEMKSTLMEVINIHKSFGGQIFFDANLPLPMWHSYVETKLLLEEALSLADFIEVTAQELDFLCGLKDKKEDEDLKFVHRESEGVKKHLWHDGLKVLFVTDGTSRVHYYTEDTSGFVKGTEDVPIEPSCADMSVSGDVLVAALMKSLVWESDVHEVASDPEYLEMSIKQAIHYALVDQMVVADESGFYFHEKVKEEDEGEDLALQEDEYRKEERENPIYDFSD